MWLTSNFLNLPRTKKQLFLTSKNGTVFCVKPGKEYVLRDKSWIEVRPLSILNDKIDKVVVSQNGRCSLHLPKHSPLFAIHENTANPSIMTLPLPHSNTKDVNEINVLYGVAPSGENLLVTSPHLRVKDVPYVMGLQNKPSTEFCSRVKGLATAETGKIFAVSVDDNLWVWQQLPEQPNGIGYWVDLTSDKRFGINIHANHPYSQEGRVYHGFMRYRQTFTLHPAIAPALPANSAVSYQDLALFDNPEEGKGVVCLTALLPPSKPYDTLYLFVSICTFKGYKPEFERAEVVLPVIEGAGGPCIWWSLDCRVAVIAVSRSLIVSTRKLDIISVIRLEDIFANKDAMVASVSWSCGGQFFVVTSTTGEISAVSRSGKSMRHSLCSLEPFTTENEVPLMSIGDSNDPNLFIIYTRARMKALKIDVDMVQQTIENLMSLHFPFGIVEEFFEPAQRSITESGYEKLNNFIRLIYLTDLFRLFPYHSPLRYLLVTIFDEYTVALLENDQHLMAFLLSRCILRVSDHKVSCYDEIYDRLMSSKTPRDRLLAKVYDDERQFKDYVLMYDDMDSRIVFYDNNYISEEETKILKKPESGKLVDVPGLLKQIKIFLWGQSEFDFSEFDVDLRLLLEISIELGQFSKAIMISHHQSLSYDPLLLYNRIISYNPNSPSIIYRAMVYCAEIASSDELEIRTLCVKSLLTILNQRVSESVPTPKNPSVPPLSKLCMIEDSLEIVIPKNVKEVDDFAVILSLAFCAANFKYLAAYINGKSDTIPANLREVIRELFGLVWFIRWRDTAIAETARVKHANDATLRLLAFPQFVNLKTAMNQIRQAGPRCFSPDAYALYYDGKRDFEMDPSFPSYMSECANRLRPDDLKRVQSMVLSLGESKRYEVPRSNLCLAVIVSHIVPWLRCGIPRAIINFPSGEVVPNELTEFEEFILPDRPEPKMEIVFNKLVNEAPEEEEEIPEYIPPPEPRSLIHETSDSGEYKPNVEPIPDSGTPSTISSDQSDVSTISEIKKKKKKRKRKYDKTVIKQEKKKKRRRKSKGEHLKIPQLRLLSLDPNAVPDRAQYIPQGPTQQFYQPHQQVQTKCQFSSPWDIDPSKCSFDNKQSVRNEIHTRQQTHSETKPQYIFVTQKKSDPARRENDPDSSSSDISDIVLNDTRKPVKTNVDAFQLDEELRNRVNRALDGFCANEPKPLPREVPRFNRYECHLYNQPPPVQIPRVVIPEVSVRPLGQNVISEERALEQQDEAIPDFLPSVSSPKTGQVIGQSTTKSNQKKMLEIREIRPTRQ